MRDGAKFCGSCGTVLEDSRGAPMVAAVPAFPVHTVADPGLQSYAQPDPSSGVGQVLAGGARVEVLGVRAAWAHVRDGSGYAGWVDGRRLVPPAAVEMPSPGPYGYDAPAQTGGGGIGPGAIIGLVGAVGVIVGSLLSWLAEGSGSDFSSFKLPVGNLFDNTNTSQDPKTGYFLIAAAIVGIVCCFVPKAGWVRIVCGVIAVAAPVLYAIQVNDAISRYSTYSFARPNLADVLGPGVWVTAIAGLVLAISGAFRTRS